MSLSLSNTVRSWECNLHKAWRKADIRTSYWSKLRDFTHAANMAKRYGLKEARAHTEVDGEEWGALVDSYR